jgi:hypothetical protein
MRRTRGIAGNVPAIATTPNLFDALLQELGLKLEEQTRQRMRPC